MLNGLLVLLDGGGLGADGGVGGLVGGLELVGGHSGGDVLRELALVGLSVILLEGLHVSSDVSTEDVLAEDLGVELGLLRLLLVVQVSGEAALGVGHVEASVGGSLHGSEDTVTSRGAGETDVEQDVEGTGSVVVLLYQEVLSVDLSLSDVLVGQVQLGQHAAGEQQTGGVGRGVVGQTGLDSVAGQLVGVGSRHHDVSLHLRVDDLRDDVLVRETNYKAELGGSILVEVLDDQVLTSLVVSETLYIHQSSKSQDSNTLGSVSALKRLKIALFWGKLQTSPLSSLLACRFYS